jgi:low temperature requirement protein LtrA
MRLGRVALWLRAARSHEQGRPCSLRYAIGITALQVLWVVRLALPGSIGLVTFLVLVALELAVPIWAESAGRTSWHPGHIAERYGLFTIIVLGESILSATVGVQVALDGDVPLGDLLATIAGGLLLVFSLWWMYFDLPADQMAERAREAFEERVNGAFLWGYGHYLVFGAAAAVGAGLAAQVDHVTHHSELSALATGFTITIPVAVYVGTLWALHWEAKEPGPLRDVAVPVGLVLILLASWSPAPVLFAGLVVASLVALHLRFGSGLESEA